MRDATRDFVSPVGHAPTQKVCTFPGNLKCLPRFHQRSITMSAQDKVANGGQQSKGYTT